MPPMPPINPSGPWVPILPASPQIHPYTPWCPLMIPDTPRSPLMPLCCLYPFWFSIVITLQLTIFAQLKTLVFYCCHFQLSSLCNWMSSWVCPVYKIPSLGVKNTSSVLWSSANFCSIFQNMHYKDPVASQHWKTNKVVWTWEDDWPPWRTSTYKRPRSHQSQHHFCMYVSHSV